MPTQRLALTRTFRSVRHRLCPKAECSKSTALKLSVRSFNTVCRLKKSHIQQTELVNRDKGNLIWLKMSTTGQWFTEWLMPMETRRRRQSLRKLHPVKNLAAAFTTRCLRRSLKSREGVAICQGQQPSARRARLPTEKSNLWSTISRSQMCRVDRFKICQARAQ